MGRDESQDALRQTRADHPGGRPDYHDPTARLGAPPALSALGLRLKLATFGLVCSLVAVVLLLVLAHAVAPAVVFGVIALVSLVDLVVVQRRRHRGEPG